MRVLAYVTSAVLALAVGCGDGGDEAAVAEPAPGGHIHGLGVNPRDGALFVATHEGLFRAPEGSSRATRVGESWQDTMGFTVVGPDHFLGSGHPDLQSDLPAYLGLIESRNGGRAWRPKSLLGKTDFHALEAGGSIVYGSGSDFESREYRFLVSEDRGRTWERRRTPEPISSVAINPEDERSILASGSNGLYSADEAGSRWRSLDGPPGLVAFAAADELYLIDGEGRVHYRDGGRWARRGKIGGAPAAFEAVQPDMLLAGLHDGSVKVSTDDGRSWRVWARL